VATNHGFLLNLQQTCMHQISTVISTIVRLSSSFKAYNSPVGIITGILNPTDDSISAILVFLKKVKQLAEN